MNLIWVLVNCNSFEEAEKIGDEALKKRLAVCFDVFARSLAKYFWPPKSGEIEKAQGALLILETEEAKYEDIQQVIKSVHSDQLPFTGFVRIEGVREDYKEWLQGELAK